MQTQLMIGQTITGLILISLVLLQAKGVGFGRTMGSSNYHSKRGVERLTFKATIVIAVSFVVLSTLQVLI